MLAVDCQLPQAARLDLALGPMDVVAVHRRRRVPASAVQLSHELRRHAQGGAHHFSGDRTSLRRFWNDRAWLPEKEKELVAKD
ncbi:MAG: hypothetical protein WDN28_20660 [Chthoniobacter sp.]